MQKVISLIIFTALVLTVRAQYFQGTLVKDPANATNARLIFKMKPTASLTTSISYIELAFRYPTAGTPTFTVSDIVSNTAAFPALNIQRLPPDFTDQSYTYVKFVHNTGTIPTFSYSPNVEYEIFSFALSGPPAVIQQIEMVSNLVSQNYYFAVNNGAGVFVDPGAGAQLYGEGFHIANNDHILPLTLLTVPVKFEKISVKKKNNDGLLTWSVENESELTDRYEVERSTNGLEYNRIATVSARRQAGPMTYVVTDLNLAAIRSTARLYYRVKEFDKNEKYILSETKTLLLGDKLMEVSIAPNPFKGMANLTVDLGEDAPIVISICDVAGKEVQKIDMKGKIGSNIQQLNFSKLAGGTYLFNVTAGKETRTLSVITYR